jgi:hypothetical protein
MNSAAISIATHIDIEPTALHVRRREVGNCIVEVVMESFAYLTVNGIRSRGRKGYRDLHALMNGGHE